MELSCRSYCEEQSQMWIHRRENENEWDWGWGRCRKEVNPKIEWKFAEKYLQCFQTPLQSTHCNVIFHGIYAPFFFFSSLFTSFAFSVYALRTHEICVFTFYCDCYCFSFISASFKRISWTSSDTRHGSTPPTKAEKKIKPRRGLEGTSKRISLSRTSLRCVVCVYRFSKELGHSKSVMRWIWNGIKEKEDLRILRKSCNEGQSDLKRGFRWPTYPFWHAPQTTPAHSMKRLSPSGHHPRSSPVV
jgi:hypothetical protein